MRSPARFFSLYPLMVEWLRDIVMETLLQAI